MIMNKKYITMLLVAASIFVGCTQEQKAASDEVLVKTVDVETQTVAPQVFERHLQLIGTVEARNDVRVSAEVSGRIEQYFVEKGDRVQKGEAILKIDDSKLRQELARLQAQALQAREQYQRLKRIFEQDSIGSEMGVIDARAIYKQRKAALKSLKVDLENTTVKAPFAGIFNEKLLGVGEMASPGTQLFRLIGTGDLRVTAGVASSFADVIDQGDNAQIWFAFQVSDTLSLPISYVSQSINPDSRTFEIGVELPSSSENYKVDMSANVKLQILKLDSSVVVGKEYIYPVENHYAVYIIGQNKEGEAIAIQQRVQLGPDYKNRTVIARGLQPGDELITAGSAFLQDGMRVKVADQKQEKLAQQNL